MYAKQYFDNDVLNKSSVELVCLLYAKAIEKLRLALVCFEQGDIKGRAKAIAAAQEIILELQGSLDPAQGGEIAANLGRLYVYLQELLSQANARKEPAKVEESIRLLEVIYEGWRTPSPNQPRPVAVAMGQPANTVPAGKVWEL